MIKRVVLFVAVGITTLVLLAQGLLVRMLYISFGGILG
jgi:hypothetical protein